MINKQSKQIVFICMLSELLNKASKAIQKEKSFNYQKMLICNFLEIGNFNSQFFQKCFAFEHF